MIQQTSRESYYNPKTQQLILTQNQQAVKLLLEKKEICARDLQRHLNFSSSDASRTMNYLKTVGTEYEGKYYKAFAVDKRKDPQTGRKVIYYTWIMKGQKK